MFEMLAAVRGSGGFFLSTETRIGHGNFAVLGFIFSSGRESSPAPSSPKCGRQLV